MTLDHYMLDGHEVVPIRVWTEDGQMDQAALMRWATWFENAERHVMSTTLIDGSVISTIFLGIDHGIGGRPQLFETCLFSSVTHYSELLKREVAESEVVGRYSTWAEAMDGHMHWIEQCVPKDLIQLTVKERKE